MRSVLDNRSVVSPDLVSLGRQGSGKYRRAPKSGQMLDRISARSDFRRSGINNLYALKEHVLLYN